MIRIENVTFSYSGGAALENVSLNIPKGSFCAIVGRNGAGKSTLLKLMRGLLKPTRGKVYVDGREVAEEKISALAPRVGYLFQNPDRQICRSSVKDELMLTLENSVADVAMRDALCEDTIKDFALCATDNPFEKSRGERQMIALASVVVSKPKLLLLDEPTTGLDEEESNTVMEAVSRLNKSGVTVVMVSHDEAIVEKYPTMIIEVGEGRATSYEHNIY